MAFYRPGLSVTPETPEENRDFDRWLEQVRETAALYEKRRGTGGQVIENLTPQPEALWPVPKERRCKAVTKAGKPCGNWAVQDAAHCRFHGGIRENPNSRAAAKAYMQGRIDRYTNTVRAKRACQQLPADVKHAVFQAHRERYGRGPAPVDLLQGSLAYMLADKDNGRAWRKWLALMEVKQNKAKNTHRHIETDTPAEPGKDEP